MKRYLIKIPTQILGHGDEFLEILVTAESISKAVAQLSCALSVAANVHCDSNVRSRRKPICEED